MLVSMALVPPEGLRAELAALRAALDPTHAHTTTPHITLKQPFECDVAAFEQIVTRVHSASATYVAFEVMLEAVAVFASPRYGSVLHLRSARTTRIDAVHTALVRIVEQATALRFEHEERVFYPHLTLAQGLSAERAELASSALSLALPRSFLALELVIGVQDERGVWSIPHRFTFAPAR